MIHLSVLCHLFRGMAINNKNAQTTAFDSIKFSLETDYFSRIQLDVHDMTLLQQMIKYTPWRLQMATMRKYTYKDHNRKIEVSQQIWEIYVWYNTASANPFRRVSHGLVVRILGTLVGGGWFKRILPQSRQ